MDQLTNPERFKGRKKNRKRNILKRNRNVKKREEEEEVGKKKNYLKCSTFNLFLLN